MPVWKGIKKPETELQELVLQLEEELGSIIHIGHLTEELSKTENRHPRSVEEIINKGKANYKQSTLERLREIIQEVRTGKDRYAYLSTGLVKIETFPDLDKCVERLYFKSNEHLFAAVSEHTNIDVEAVRAYFYCHLETGRREVRDCLYKLMEMAGKGQRLSINDEHRGISSKIFIKLVDLVVSNSQFSSKRKLAHAIADSTGRNLSTVYKGYFFEDDTKNIPWDVYKKLVKIAKKHIKKMPGFVPFRRNSLELYREALGFASYEDMCNSLSNATGIPYSEIFHYRTINQGRKKVQQKLEELSSAFKPYSPSDSYKKRDALYDPSANDCGIVRMSGKKSMAVKWAKQGSLIMVQNDRG